MSNNPHPTAAQIEREEAANLIDSVQRLAMRHIEEAWEATHPLRWMAISNALRNALYCLRHIPLPVKEAAYKDSELESAREYCTEDDKDAMLQCIGEVFVVYRHAVEDAWAE
jgi:hypothetical protein